MAIGWVTIDIEPMDQAYFLPILTWICDQYKIPQPLIHDTIDGYATDFALHGSIVMYWIDAWTFAIGFENPAVRDRVYQHLIALPDGYFTV